ncbi:hypothetical protein, partial [Paraburkholderia sp. SIMBA_027]
WTKEQHDYGIEYLAKTQKEHPGLKKQIAAYLDMGYEGPLKSIGKRTFQTIQRKGDKHSKTYTILNGEKILIWDPMQIDNSGNISTVGISYSYDGERAAVSTQKSGAEVKTVYFIE